MSSLLLRSAAGALRRSTRLGSSLPRPGLESPRLLSSGFPAKKQPDKLHGNSHILKHKKPFIVEEKELLEALDIVREENKQLLEKHSRLLKEAELRKRSTEMYGSLKELMLWTAVSYFALSALCKTQGT